jgi:DNA-binding CsgD family transcriptional regulator
LEEAASIFARIDGGVEWPIRRGTLESRRRSEPLERRSSGGAERPIRFSVGDVGKEAGGVADSRGRQGSSRAAGPDEPRLLPERLTKRETEILQLVADGLVTPEIAKKLTIAPETVKTHMHHILAKLEARSRAHAVTIGFRRGLID